MKDKRLNIDLLVVKSGVHRILTPRLWLPWCFGSPHRGKHLVGEGGDRERGVRGSGPNGNDERGLGSH